jgi:hypothetical protein
MCECIMWMWVSKDGTWTQSLIDECCYILYFLFEPIYRISKPPYTAGTLYKDGMKYIYVSVYVTWYSD